MLPGNCCLLQQTRGWNNIDGDGNDSDGDADNGNDINADGIDAAA